MFACNIAVEIFGGGTVSLVGGNGLGGWCWEDKLVSLARGEIQ